MDLFGTKKRKALQYSVEYMKAILGPVQYVQGLPPFFWSDGFVLVFVSCSIVSCTKLVAKGLSAEDLGLVIASAFQELSNMNGFQVAGRATEIMEAKTSDALLGSKNAAIIFGYNFGLLPEDNLEVLDAKDFAQSEDRDKIAGALTYTLFNQVIRQRFKN